eukprot:756120-Rhodomonas_salina.1
MRGEGWLKRRPSPADPTSFPSIPPGAMRGTSLLLTSLQFGKYVCSVDNHTFSQTQICTDVTTGKSWAKQPKEGAFHVETAEPPLIDHWPGIANCLGKDHGDRCWNEWDV